MTTATATSSLFEELAQLFASAPSANAILDFRPTQATITRAKTLLDLNRENRLDADQLEELNQFEQAELLMRLVKARIHQSRLTDRPPQ